MDGYDDDVKNEKENRDMRNGCVENEINQPLHDATDFFFFNLLPVTQPLALPTLPFNLMHRHRHVL